LARLRGADSLKLQVSFAKEPYKSKCFLATLYENSTGNA